MASSRLKPLSSWRVCRCRSRTLASSSLRRLASWILSVSLRRALRPSSPACGAVRPALRGVLPLVQQAFAFVQLAAQPASSFSLSACAWSVNSLISSSASRRRLSTSCPARRTISRASDSASRRRKRSNSRVSVNVRMTAATIRITGVTRGTAWLLSRNPVTMHLRPQPRRTAQEPRRRRAHESPKKMDAGGSATAPWTG